MIKVRFVPLVTGILLIGMVIGGCAQQATPAPSPTPAPAVQIPVVPGKQGLDLSSYGKIELEASHIEVSSTHEVHGKENLLTELGYWHVKFPKETDEAWVIVDLGHKGRLDVLAIKPGIDFPHQSWRGDTAVLEKGNDMQDWTPLARLEIKVEELNGQDWIAFVLPENADSYRYYRLLITYPNFLSLGGLAVYGEDGIPPAETPAKSDIPAVQIPVVPGKQGLDLSSYGKIELEASHIEVSSTHEVHGKENLLTELGYWHVKFPKETDEAWVIVDLGHKGRLDVLAIKPGIDFPHQSWRGDTAVLEKGNDMQDWTPLARLEIKVEELNGQDWIAFVLPENADSYRYYRLLITYPNFLSLGGLAVYGEDGIPPAETPAKSDIPVVQIPVVPGKTDVYLRGYEKIKLEESHIEVSSVNSPHEGKASLVDGKLDTHWHVKHPPEKDQHWVVIDLGTPKKIEALAAIPTPGRPEQFWNADHATIQGRNDPQQDWYDIARLSVEKDKLDRENPDWIYFIIPNSAEYRYYRLFIKDKFFLSLGELRVCGEGVTTVTGLPAVLGTQDKELMSTYNKINLFAGRIELSSAYKIYEGKQSLINGLGNPFWGVKFPKETDEAWVIVDLKSETKLDALAVRPRTGFAKHLWSGDAAVLEGSNDKEEWTPLVRLELKIMELNDRDWIDFILPEDLNSYRYYRLFITDPNFQALGGLRIYGNQTN